MYRVLSDSEINDLKNRGCRSGNWSLVEFKGECIDFDRFCNVEFVGSVKIGYLIDNIELNEGLYVASSIKNVILHNSIIGDNVYINKVSQSISNVTIKNSVIINCVDSITAKRGATFGNGVEVAVIDESGGRKIPIFDKLTAQIAYISALYRHDRAIMQNIWKIVACYCDVIVSEGAVIGEGARILNCGKIDNVRIGEFATIEGAISLENGSINSSKAAQVYIGCGVVCRDFIISPCAKITDSAIIEKTFVGEGCEIGKQFSAENTLFFANCIAFHGEAVALFAAPYTVSHHKSTLLIAALTSFINLGSGTNQSNHMYKMGAIHQGILERGVKTASNSHLIWPMRVGAFSMVMGKHSSHADLSDFPFSYLIEDRDGSTLLMPALNLRSVGTLRDVNKWPKRDKRIGCEMLDKINFKLFSPYVVQKMVVARELLRGFVSQSDKDSNFIYYNGCKIKRSSITVAMKLYTLAISRFLGDILDDLVEKISYNDILDLIQERKMCYDGATELTLSDIETIRGDRWLDIAGLIAPKSKIDSLVARLIQGEFTSIEQLQENFEKLHSNYSVYELVWALDLLKSECVENVERVKELTAETIENFRAICRKNRDELNSLILEDANKEHSKNFRVGFGIDGDATIAEQDFKAVRASLPSFCDLV